MRGESQNWIVEEFPEIMSECRLGYSFGNGWNDLVREFLTKAKMIDPDLKVLQIKEKFGGIRIYYGVNVEVNTEEIRKLCRDAEDKSYLTCEFCGKPGELRDTDWQKTACDLHYQKYLEKKSWLDIDEETE